MIGDEDLDALIDSVVGHEPVDWNRAERDPRDPGQRARFVALRNVAKLAEFHHSLQGESGAAAGRAIERWGELLLLERVGAGASGEVYRAWDRTLQREVALKLLGAVDAAPALEEARALAGVRHPNVAAVYGAAEHDGRAGLWMEFVHGSTLEAEISRRGALPWGEVARAGIQVGSALQAAHAAGTLHRDVKPANVVLASEGRAVLTDFGLGRRAEARAALAPFSGTPLFMSPQRLAGASAKPADDVYALGVTLLWALTGAAPFAAESLDGLRTEAARGPARALREQRPDAPAALVVAIERAMAPEPGARFASAAALVAAIEAAVAGSASAARRTPARVPVVAALLLLGAAVALIATWALRRPAPVAPPPVPAAPAAASYDVAASFLLRGATGDTPLDTGDRISPGDRVSLEFRASRPTWVYVLDADERGECYLLFPQPMFDRANPLPGDAAVVLPGTRGGRESAWTVTSRGGRERLLIVANPGPIPELEADLAHMPAPVPGAPIRYARITGSSVQTLRGMGGVSEAPSRAGTARAAGAFERIRALAGREQGVRGTWVRQVVLENPLR